MGKKYNPNSSFETPGPASYRPSDRKSSQALAAPAFTMGSRNIASSNSNMRVSGNNVAVANFLEGPGPSDYHTDRKFSTDEFKKIKFS
jgi:hypothetical protein